MPVRLPGDPKREDYEDLVAAVLAGCGYFIETNLHLREESTEVLELDVVATPIDDPLNSAFLVDAKSGATGFGDVFKMSGWMSHIGMGRGYVVRSTPPHHAEAKAMASIAERAGIEVVTFRLKGEIDDFPPGAWEVDADTQGALVNSAWWGRIAQRSCLSSFNSYVKAMKESEAAAAARKYRWRIEQSFFAETPIDRATRLYQAYSEAPKLTEQLVAELSGGDEGKHERIWNEVRGSSERQPLQHTMVMESRARLGILKNALLHVLHREAEGKPEDVRERMKRIWPELVMPGSFLHGLNYLREHVHRMRIPLLMQLFIEVFGGFYCTHDDRDIAALSAVTGIPHQDIEGCLGVFDELFPVPNGWFFEKNALRQMKAVPGVYRGTGAWLRQRLFDEKDYEKLHPRMGWLLSRWHNAIYHILEPRMGVHAA